MSRKFYPKIRLLTIKQLDYNNSNIAHTVISSDKLQFSLPTTLAEGLYSISVIDNDQGTVYNERIVITDN
jgi:hypothetical protein